MSRAHRALSPARPISSSFLRYWRCGGEVGRGRGRGGLVVASPPHAMASPRLWCDPPWPSLQPIPPTSPRPREHDRLSNPLHITFPLFLVLPSPQRHPHTSRALERRSHGPHGTCNRAVTHGPQCTRLPPLSNGGAARGPRAAATCYSPLFQGWAAAASAILEARAGHLPAIGYRTAVVRRTCGCAPRPASLPPPAAQSTRSPPATCALSWSPSAACRPSPPRGACARGGVRAGPCGGHPHWQPACVHVTRCTRALHRHAVQAYARTMAA